MMHGVPLPERLVILCPHPDDLSISLGACAAAAAESGVRVEAALLTDGSEAYIPEDVLRAHGWGEEDGAAGELRGRIRVAEAVEEARRLGLGEGCVRLLTRQTWFSRHCTPAEFLREDGSLLRVEGFTPGPVESTAVEEVAGALGGGGGVICAVPEPEDRLLMHRITTALGAAAARRASAPVLGVLTYECFTTVGPLPGRVYFGFDETAMRRKQHAIRAHHSMRERRRQLGGYSTAGAEFYDTMVERWNREAAREGGLASPYAERFGWYPGNGCAGLIARTGVAAPPLGGRR